MHGYICPLCGAALDPGEKCSCLDEREQEQRRKEQALEKITSLLCQDKNGQLRIVG